MGQKKYLTNFLFMATGFFILTQASMGWAAEGLAGLRQGKEKELASYVRLLSEKEAYEGKLAGSESLYLEDGCDQSGLDTDCASLKTKIKFYKQKIRELNVGLASAIKKLGNYVDLANKTAEDLKNLAGKNQTAQQLEQVTGCLSSLGIWNPAITTLYADSMRTLRGKNKGKFLAVLKKLPGFSQKDCTDEFEIDCWREKYGQYYYVAKGHIHISESCLIKPKKDGSQFFYNDPREYLKAAESVAGTITKKGCLERMNSDSALKLAHYLSTSNPRVHCTPETPGENNRPDRCAYTERHTVDIFVTAPLACGSLGRTMFHEFLHAEGTIDNLKTAHHNNGVCRKFDAVYHCADMCFPDFPKPAYLHQKGCEACVEPEKQSLYCSKLPEEIGTEIQDCGWGGM